MVQPLQSSIRVRPTSTTNFTTHWNILHYSLAKSQTHIAIHYKIVSASNSRNNNKKTETWETEEKGTWVLDICMQKLLQSFCCLLLWEKGFIFGYFIHNPLMGWRWSTCITCRPMKQSNFPFSSMPIIEAQISVYVCVPKLDTLTTITVTCLSVIPTWGSDGRDSLKFLFKMLF